MARKWNNRLILRRKTQSSGTCCTPTCLMRKRQSEPNEVPWVTDVGGFASRHHCLFASRLRWAFGQVSDDDGVQQPLSRLRPFVILSSDFDFVMVFQVTLDVRMRISWVANEKNALVLMTNQSRELCSFSGTATRFAQFRFT